MAKFNEQIGKAIIVKAIRTCCRSGEEFEVDLKVGITEGLSGKVFSVIKGGVTTYESFYIEKQNNAVFKKGWNACIGTKHRWDKLFITKAEMQRAYKELNIKEIENG